MVLSDGESSSEADQDTAGTPLLALVNSSPHCAASPRRSRPSSLAPLPEAALSALCSAVTGKMHQLQVTTTTTPRGNRREWRCPTPVKHVASFSVSLLCSVLSQDIRGRLLSAQTSLQQLKKQLAESESAKKEAEQQTQALRSERDAAQRERDTTQREKERVKQERDALARFEDTCINFYL